MARGFLLLGAVVSLWLAAAAPSWADTVTLASGDVLHGDVREEGGRVKIRNPVLGEIDVARGDVLWIAREGEPAPVSAGTVASTAQRVAAPCDPCAKAAVERCPSPWDFAVGVGISNEAGNTEKFALNADLEAGYRWSANTLRWRVNGFYEESRGVQTEGKYFSNLRYGRRITPRSNLFALWIVDRDDFADINLRNGWFVGYQREFVKRKRTTFSGSVGAGAVVEDRSNAPTFETVSLLAELEFKHQFSGGDTFEAKGYVIPYIDNTELSPSRLELRYAHPLRDHLDIVVGFLADYVPDPPGDLESLDTKITFGIRWKK